VTRRGARGQAPREERDEEGTSDELFRSTSTRTMLVPDLMATAVSEVIPALVMLCPGAQMSRHGPKLLNHDTVSSSVAFS
jgi:hypothetical protein